MAVITRYIVVRHGVELDKVFEVKKEADAYDKMLDAAENLAAFIKKSDLEIDLDDEVVDAVSICLAKNAPEVTKILKGVRPAVKSSPAPATEKTEKPASSSAAKEKKTSGRKTKAKRK